MMDHRHFGARRRHALVVVLGLLLAPIAASAAPVAMRFPEGPAHGFITLSDLATEKPIGHGEVIQWNERRAIASRLVIRFDDGSLYDEIVRFEQRPAFRVLSYQLTQKGPSFPDDSRIEFDRSGKYNVRQKPHGEDEKTASGTTEIPDDVSNGMTSVLAKNLPSGAAAATHLMTFTPEPLVLDLAISRDGAAKYSVGGVASEARRFLIKPTVPGVKGVLAAVAGKQPPEVHMWIAPEPAPVLVRFEGALFVNGPPWLIELSAPRWKR
jgi:hypothetical protein